MTTTFNKRDSVRVCVCLCHLVSSKAPQVSVRPGEHNVAALINQVKSIDVSTQDAVSFQSAAVRRLCPPDTHSETTH